MDESLEDQGRVVVESWTIIQPWRALVTMLRWAQVRRAELLSWALLATMALQMLAVIARKSITNDEVVSIPAGYYHLAAGNFQISVDHPPLTKMYAAFPLLFIQPNELPITVRPGEGALPRTLRAQEEFWSANATHFKAISFWSRVPMITLTLALGVLIFIYARQLFGRRAALFAVFLFSLEPTVLAHGRTALNDLPAALSYLLFFFALHAYLKAPGLPRALTLGLATGLAVMTKFSMVIVVPVFFLIAVISIWMAPRRGEARGRAAWHMGLATLTTILVINAGYYFQGQPPQEAEFRWLTSILSPAHLSGVMICVRALSKVVPTYLLSGIDAVLARNSGIDAILAGNGYGQTASLLGAYSDTGWWYYFPAAFALKTTIPFLLTSVAALAWALWRLLIKRDRLFLPLLVPLGIYVLVSMMSQINIGIRHFLPAFPFVFILGGAFFDRLLRPRRAGQVALMVVVLLTGWIVVEAVRAYPNHMSYMNELTWRHPPWYYLSDSNIEWGDDVADLATYLRARGETKVRAALLGGWATLPRYGVDYISLLVPADVQLPETRYVAIGASFLNGSTVAITGPGPQRQDFFSQYRDRKPEAVFGNSIYLYLEK
jgi:4-amino-4-deoxy-L-arabinose transferase-like glycosyltransferase